MEQTLNNWARISSHFIGECFDIAKPYLDKAYDKIDPYVRFVNSQLFIDCHLSSESSLMLVKSGKEWDADIINRSVMEGTIKYAFLMNGSPDEVKRKAFEFWELLPNYASVKRSSRANGLLKALEKQNHDRWLPIEKLLLTDDDINEIRSDINRAERIKLEQKWSFSGITREFNNNDSEGLGVLAHLAQGYGMSSHLIHKDGDGVGMVWERYRRPKDEQDVVKLAHCARITSDICTFSKLRLFQLLKFCGKNTDKVSEFEKGYQPFFDDLSNAYKHFIKVEYGE